MRFIIKFVLFYKFDLFNCYLNYYLKFLNNKIIIIVLYILELNYKNLKFKFAKIVHIIKFEFQDKFYN
jgi:hypothetical protein